MRFCPECGLEADNEVRVCPRDGARLVRLDPRDQLVGHNLNGRYELSRRIGRGGMGTVYEAVQEPVGRRVAVKVLRSDLAADARGVERFLREAQVVSKLRHPNTVTLFDFGKADTGHLYFAMEFMEGRRLDDFVTKTPPTLEEILELAEQIAQSLHEAHEQGVVHRDLKPENVFVDRVSGQNVIKVLDFGIAKVRDAGETLTRTGKVFGTPAFMSPEQAQGFELDGRSDLYALGIVLVEMLTGRLPFEAESAMGVAMAHILEPPPDIQKRSRYGPLPRRLVDLVTRLLAKDPDDRPASGDAVASELAGIRRALSLDPDAERVTPPPREPGGAGRSDGGAGDAEASVRAFQSLDRSADLEAVSAEKARAPTGTEHAGVDMRRALFWASLLVVLGLVAVFLHTAPGPGTTSPGIPGTDTGGLATDEDRTDAGGETEPGPIGTLVTTPGVGGGTGTGGGHAAPPVLAVITPEGPADAALPEPVTVAFELHPGDASVYLAGHSEPLCTGPACTSVDLPFSQGAVTVRIARRRYLDQDIELVPNRAQRVVVSLEREAAERESVVVVEERRDEDVPETPDAGSSPDAGSETPREGLMPPVTLP